MISSWKITVRTTWFWCRRHISIHATSCCSDILAYCLGKMILVKCLSSKRSAHFSLSILLQVSLVWSNVDWTFSIQIASVHFRFTIKLNCDPAILTVHFYRFGRFNDIDSSEWRKTPLLFFYYDWSKASLFHLIRIRYNVFSKSNWFSYCPFIEPIWIWVKQIGAGWFIKSSLSETLNNYSKQ